MPTRPLLLSIAVALAGTTAAGCEDSTVGGNVMVAVQIDAGPDVRKGNDGQIPTGPVDGGFGAEDAPAAVACFAGKPTTHEQFLNACWADTVTAVTKTATLPGGYKAGDPLPPLP
jgi:hypothetical protein